jgi:magnesium transporter
MGESYVSDPAYIHSQKQLPHHHRTNEFRSFSDISKKVLVAPKSFPSGYQVMLSLFESRVDIDADLLEHIAREISRIGKFLGTQQKADRDILIRITQLQEMTMMLRQNMIDKQRMVSAMLRSDHFPKDCYDRLRMLIKDVNSLMDHITFNFDRLEYLQDTFLGLINIEQNKIIKIFTVVSVFFLPPTLVASIYGMNFQGCPS